MFILQTAGVLHNICTVVFSKRILFFSVKEIHFTTKFISDLMIFRVKQRSAESEVKATSHHQIHCILHAHNNTDLHAHLKEFHSVYYESIPFTPEKYHSK